MTYKRKETIGDCELYLGDCLSVMPTLGKVDAREGWAILTDPPYGIGADKGHTGASSFNGSKKIQHRSYKGGWDSERPSEAIQLFASIKCPQIIWGGNYLADLLPAMGKWLWWDKCQTMPTFGDGELAWTNLKGATPRKFTLANNQLFADRVERFHPTQKPLKLMQWCINHLPDNCDTILDPFMGSGTTLVACAKMGRKGIGIELDPDYFEIACKRVEDAYRQPDLFIAPPEKPEMEQGEFLTTKLAEGDL
jgi:site-specific DNA-methyltransferase (adenine-specific)/modification methylase